MTKTDWFVKLEYGKYNFLISQDIIIEAGDANFDNKEEESFIGNFDVFFPDQVVSKTNNIRLKEFKIHIMQSRKMVISTSVIPSPVQLDLGKLKPLTVYPKDLLEYNHKQSLSGYAFYPLYDI